MAAPLPIDRRRLLSTGASAVAGAAAFAPQTLRAETQAADLQDETFHYQVTRTEAEWRERLAPSDYKILREASTELPDTSPLARETGEGHYHCKGCDLTVFASQWKVPLDKGWAFFAHAQENAVLTAIDGPQQAYGMSPDGFGNLIEVHCRRCGSHLGHHLLVSGQMLYCINGASLTFAPHTA